MTEATEEGGVERMSETQVGDDYKDTVLSGQSRAAAHMNSQRLRAQVRLARIRADRVPASRKSVDIPTLS